MADTSLPTDNDIFSQFGVSPNDYYIDPVTNTIKLKDQSQQPQSQQSQQSQQIQQQPTQQLALPAEQPQYDPASGVPYPTNPAPDFSQVSKGEQRLFGLNGEDRYQLWPERMVRSGLSLPADVMTGAVPITDDSGHTSQQVIERSLDTAGLAGIGGLSVGTTDATLGSAPFLRPALKYEGKIYKGAAGEEHPVPDHLRADFQDKALTGEDLSNYNFGFVNHKGQFLSREKALDYAIEQGIVPPEYGKFGALTTTMLNDNKVGTAIAANKPFYSTLENNIANAKVAKATPEQWQAYLKNQPGVKPEELEFSGIGDVPSGQPITKEQLLQHVQDNGIKVGEVWKGGFNEIDNDRFRYLNNKENLTEAEHLELNNLDIKRHDRAKFSSYQLPGGENYRELLLTLPENSNRLAQIDNRLKEIILSKEHTGETAKEYDRLLEERGSINTTSLYQSSHWDEPNVLAHIRMNDRFIPDEAGPSTNPYNTLPDRIGEIKPDQKGLKDLHIEEIQSDWHQAGRKQGYKEDLEAKITKQYEEAKANNDITGMRIANDAQRNLLETDAIRNNASKPPNAPFKKTWDELAFKRALKEAIDNGYDSISWTPGEAQAARYDLSTHINNMHVKKYDNGQYELRIRDINDRLHNPKLVSEQELINTVGKDMADRIVDDLNKSNSKQKLYKNLDLKTEHQGMKAFYDKMLVDKANSLVKKFGGKVEYKELQTKGQVPHEDQWMSGDRAMDLAGIPQNQQQEFWYRLSPEERVQFRNDAYEKLKQETKIKIPLIRITPKMREEIGSKGLPLYSSGVPIFTPVDKKPEFKDQPKLTPVPYRPVFPGEVI